MDILIGISIIAIFSTLCLTLIAFKLLHILQKSMNIEDSGFKDIFIPNKSNRQNQQNDREDPQVPDDTVPIDQFKPRTDQPIKVHYSEDDEGNTMTEVKEDETK